MLLTLNVGFAPQFFLGHIGHDFASKFILLTLAGPRDLHMFVRRNMEWVYPLLKYPLDLHSFNEIDQ